MVRTNWALRERLIDHWPVLGLTAIVSILAFAIISAIAPPFQPLPRSDSAVFIYIGDQLLDGVVPYRDVWDHKGPLIYYINALGLLIRSNSLWGIWFLQMISVIFSAVLGFDLMRKAFGNPAALFGSVVWLFALEKVLDGGNLVEEYALPLQFGILWLYWYFRNRNSSPWVMLLIGILVAGGFLLRPNILGIGIAIALVIGIDIYLEKNRSSWRYLLAMAAGAGLVILLVGTYFSFTRALPSLIGAVFTYNFAYSSTTWMQRWESILVGIRSLPLLAVFALAGWLVGALVFREISKSPKIMQMRSFILMLLLALPLEIILTAVSGRGFPHYYMSWLPVLALLSAFLLLVLFEKMGDTSQKFIWVLTIGLLISTSSVALPRVFQPMSTLGRSLIIAGELPNVDLDDLQLAHLITYLEDNLEEDEGLVLWGHALATNWYSQHNNPTKYIYHLPFYVPGYASSQMVTEYIDSLDREQPVIIDTWVGREDGRSLTFPPGDIPETLQPLYDYFYNNYTYVGDVPAYQWPVYRYAGPDNN